MSINMSSKGFSFLFSCSCPTIVTVNPVEWLDLVGAIDTCSHSVSIMLLDRELFIAVVDGTGSL